MADIVNMIVGDIITALEAGITAGHIGRYPIAEYMELRESGGSIVSVAPNDPDDDAWRHEIDRDRYMIGQTAYPWKRCFTVTVHTHSGSTRAVAAALASGLMRDVENVILSTMWSTGPDDHGESITSPCGTVVQSYERAIGGEDEFLWTGKVRVVFLTGG